jgi:hypothetical protein
MSFDPSRLHRGELIVGAGSVVLLASLLLLPWYGYAGAAPARSRTLDGWHALTHLRWLVVVTVLVAGVFLFFQATRRAPAIPVTLSLLVVVLGGLSAAWLLYRVGINPAGGRKVGGWVALASAIAIAYGGGSSLHREGLAPRDAPAMIPTVDPWAQGGS